MAEGQTHEGDRHELAQDRQQKRVDLPDDFLHFCRFKASDRRKPISDLVSVALEEMLRKWRRRARGKEGT